MAHSPRYEARLDAAWRDLIDSVNAPRAELRVAPPRARRKALAAVARGLREPGLKHLPLVQAIPGELRKAAEETGF